jgi:hypothetical protein
MEDKREFVKSSNPYVNQNNMMESNIEDKR